MAIRCMLKELIELSSSGVCIDMTEEIKCPVCGSKTTLRIAKKGTNAGRKFYVCTNYPKCKGKILKSDAEKPKQADRLPPAPVVVTEKKEAPKIEQHGQTPTPIQNGASNDKKSGSGFKVFLALLVIVGIGYWIFKSCSPAPDFTHTSFYLDPNGNNWQKTITVYAEKGNTLEGYFTTSGECYYECGGLSLSILPPSTVTNYPYGEWMDSWDCDEGGEFDPKLDYTGNQRMVFSYINAKSFCDEVLIDLYYRVR